MGARARHRRGRAAGLSARTPVPALHLVATDDVARAPAFVEQAGELLGVGGSGVALHLRLRGASGAVLHAVARRLAPIAAAAGAALIVNDRVDVALAARCSGVHLGRGGIPLRDARAIAGRALLVGASVHDAGEARDAERAGADYLFVGTLYPTATHPGRPAAGPEILRELQGIAIPRIGIGGITPDRVGEVLDAGGDGVAVVRGIWSAPSPRRALLDYLRELGGR